jgi:hypothetical protein
LHPGIGEVLVRLVKGSPALQGQPGEVVSTVDPADVKSVWECFQDTSSSGECQALGIELLRQMCGPGANVEAVTYRVWMLRALQRTRPELFAGWRQGKDLHRSVFSVAARIKMTGMEIGKTYDNLPFDIDEFVRELPRDFV